MSVCCLSHTVSRQLAILLFCHLAEIFFWVVELSCSPYPTGEDRISNRFILQTEVKLSFIHKTFTTLTAEVQGLSDCLH